MTHRKRTRQQKLHDEDDSEKRDKQKEIIPDEIDLTEHSSRKDKQDTMESESSFVSGLRGKQGKINFVNLN